MSLRTPLLLVLAVAALSVPSACTRTAATAPEDTSHREWIAGGPIPSRYEISITPNDAASTFAGEETITVRATEAASAITLNALDIIVQSATIDGAAARVQMDEAHQQMTLTPQASLSAGQHAIHIVYAGKIQDGAFGLFRTTYTDHGHEKHLLITQFEPSDARRLAPMWDQPNRRAVFALTVTAPAGQNAVSNMQAINTEHLQGGSTRVHFADSPPMASYLVFVGVGELDRITTNVDGIEVGVITRRGQAARGRYALQSAADVLHYYRDYFGIAYPLPKLDMIGAPGEGGGFAAMENWGAILYFDQYLLLDDNLSSEADRQFVFDSVAHEIAHQWFGDLVTMNWWNDLWLNEGFASWMASKATEHLHPEWAPWRSALNSGTARVMVTDARAGTHPVVRPVNTIDEANLAFDGITYSKGLAVIRMIEAYVGEDAFRTGVRNYLSAHRLGNTVSSDLWSAVQAASGQPVLQIAHDFTEQSGYPIVRATGAACANGSGNSQIELTQKRFALDDTARTQQMWSIPIVARRLNGQALRTVMPARASANIDVPPGCGAYLVNAGQTAYFHVLYDQRNFDALAAGFATLDADDQLGMLLDYWAFARSGDATFTSYLQLVSTLPANVDPVVAMDTADSMTAFLDYARGRPSEAAVRGYGRAVLAPFFQRVGWTPHPGETPNDSLLRAKLVTALGELGDPDVIAEARRRVEASRRDPSALPGSVRNAAFGVYAYNATPAQLAALISQARAATDFVEQRRLWGAIGQVNDNTLAQQLLNMTLGNEIPRPLRPAVISRVAGNHPRMAWDFLVAHRPAIENILEAGLRLEFPTGIAANSADPAMAAELDRYAANFPAGARPQVDGAKATILLRADAVRNRFPAAEAWIAQHPNGR
ncbi:MAG: M1 family metallopeptidase [Vitreimonas sp.]